MLIHVMVIGLEQDDTTGNRTEQKTVWNHKSHFARSSDLFNFENGYRLNWTTRSKPQFIITKTESDYL